ncbi:MAG: potassium transporter TrkG [Desulfobacterales bacterium]
MSQRADRPTLYYTRRGADPIRGRPIGSPDFDSHIFFCLQSRRELSCCGNSSCRIEVFRSIWNFFQILRTTLSGRRRLEPGSRDCFSAFRGAGLSFADALFEAISGATTTGLSTVKAPERMPESFLFLRAWMQWYGGLGIVVLSLALVLRPGTVAKDLAVTESNEKDLVGGAKVRARKIFWIYSLMTATGIGLLMLLGVGPYQAVLYAMAAVSTGGFAPHANSLAAFKAWPAQVAVILICLAGAVPLISYHRWFRRSRRRGADLHHLGAVVGCGLLLTFLVGFFTWRSAGRFEPDKMYHIPLLVFSAQTTAGFSTQNPAKLGAASKLGLIAAMMIGGSPGSTAGGFKVMRLLLGMQLIYMLIMKSSLARHAVVSPQLWGRRLTPDDIQESVAIILLFIGVVGVSWLIFVAAGYAPLDSLFEVTSATGTVGLSVGITRTDLPALLKGVLCADMLMGRLEMAAWLVFLYPRTWIGRRRS